MSQSECCLKCRRIRSVIDMSSDTFYDENFPTNSSLEQHMVEAKCIQRFHAASNNTSFQFNRDETVKFLLHGLLCGLDECYSSLDASRTWLVYWVLNSLHVLDASELSNEQRCDIISFLSTCQDRKGGFGGGPGQSPHLAPTFAAVSSLVLLEDDQALRIIDRNALMSWLFGLKEKCGGFRMHSDGEIDVRGVYCALVVARLTNIFDDNLFHDTASWILKCQTFEGGFGACPGAEAHGGYTFCAVAGLVLLGKEKLILRLNRLLQWVSNRQCGVEGGFQGRVGKLVDGCYSYWVGAIFPLIHNIILSNNLREVDPTSSQGIVNARGLPHSTWMFDMEALQEYILFCCNSTSREGNKGSGGLVDKPGKHADYYHTCYGLSGLSIAQHSMNRLYGDSSVVHGSTFQGTWRTCPIRSDTCDALNENKMNLIHPLFNSSLSAVNKAHVYFSQCVTVPPQILIPSHY